MRAVARTGTERTKIQRMYRKRSASIPQPASGPFVASSQDRETRTGEDRNDRVDRPATRQ
jgi:hypothetical protein